MIYKIRNWARFQHYHDRNPPWIKLHFETLSSSDWVMLADASRVVMVACMLIASRNDGCIDGSDAGLSYIKRVAYLDKTPNIKPLIECGFLVPQTEALADASGCLQVLADARPETETQKHTETEKQETTSLGAGAPFGGYQPIVDAYHELLPKCHRAATPTPKRLKRLANATKLAKQVCAGNGWSYEPDTFWHGYFTVCASDPWMRGDVPNPNNARWKQNLDVLLADDRLAQVIDQAIESMREAA